MFMILTHRRHHLLIVRIAKRIELFLVYKLSKTQMNLKVKWCQTFTERESLIASIFISPYNFCSMTAENPIPSRKRSVIALLLLIAALLVVWLSLTPDGVSAKLAAVGFAFCHQIESHTLTLGSRLLPLCARCTGMYLGTFIGLSLLSPSRRAGSVPSRGKIVALSVLALFFVVDGLNSTASTFFAWQGLYEPNNTLRLFSGLGLGMVIASVLLPLWNNILWREYRPAPVLRSWGQLLLMAAIEAGAGILVLTGWNWLYYPVAFLSILTIPLLLTMIYTLLWVMIKKKENTFQNWRECVIYIEAGLITTLVQIGLFDLIRWLLTGSWAGFHL